MYLEWNFTWVILKLILVIDGRVISCEFAVWWISPDIIDDKSTLVQVMAWCRQATSHYLSQCWPRFMSPYVATRPQWVNFHLPISTEFFYMTWLTVSFLILKWYDEPLLSCHLVKICKLTKNKQGSHHFFHLHPWVPSVAAPGWVGKLEVVNRWSTRIPQPLLQKFKPQPRLQKFKLRVPPWPLTYWPIVCHTLSPHEVYLCHIYGNNPWNQGWATEGTWHAGRTDRVKPIYPTQLHCAGV